MNLLVWLVIGAFTGSLAAMIMRERFGLAGNVVLGIAGALCGGLACARGDLANTPLTITTFCVPLIAAIALPGIANLRSTSALR